MTAPPPPPPLPSPGARSATLALIRSSPRLRAGLLLLGGLILTALAVVLVLLLAGPDDARGMGTTPATLADGRAPGAGATGGDLCSSEKAMSSSLASRSSAARSSSPAVTCVRS